jgi:hypothetical protein
MVDCRRRRRCLVYPKLQSRRRLRCRRASLVLVTGDARTHNDHVHYMLPQHPAGGVASVPPSPCFLIPSSIIGHRLFASNMLRNVGELRDAHQWYFSARLVKRLLTPPCTVTFDKDSHGQLAAVIYEWSDVGYLGKVTSYTDNLPVSVSAIHRSGRVLTTLYLMSY